MDDLGAFGLLDSGLPGSSGMAPFLGTYNIVLYSHSFPLGQYSCGIMRDNLKLVGRRAIIHKVSSSRVRPLAASASLMKPPLMSDRSHDVDSCIKH
jgi:hypothetical protein